MKHPLMNTLGRALFAGCLSLLLLGAGPLQAAGGDKGRGGKDPGGLRSAGPATGFSVVLGRPTDCSVTLSLLSAEDREICIEYGTTGTPALRRTPLHTLQAGVPTELVLEGLSPDSHYTYRLLGGSPGAREHGTLREGSLQTQRAPGHSFSFGIQGDSHPEREGKMFSPSLYRRTMDNAALGGLDFYVMLGDDFSIERLIAQESLSQASVDAVYAHQRSFLDTVTRSAALFLVNGNHEQAALANLKGRSPSPALLAGRARTRFFSLPAPDGFYGGNREPVPELGLPRDYYSWTWGDALFVVIDPYWHSAVTVDNEAGARARGGEQKSGKTREGQSDRKGGGKGGRDLWGITLGDAQYHWLARTLTESKARWKFVFTHHVLGTGRGGIECAPFFEWGGRDRGGMSTFSEKRPGWPMPIHQLLRTTGVTILFQGHDHLFARQELDGVVYQSCPNPADPTYTAFNREAYRSGDILPNSGHLRVTVAADQVRVDYVSSVQEGDEGTTRRNATIAHSYTIRASSAGGAR